MMKELEELKKENEKDMIILGVCSTMLIISIILTRALVVV